MLQNRRTSMCRRAEDCLRLLCEHGANVNAEVKLHVKNLKENSYK